MAELKKEAYALSDEELEQVSGGYSLDDILGELNKGTGSTGIQEAIEGIKDEVTGFLNKLTDKDGQSIVSLKKSKKRGVAKAISCFLLTLANYFGFGEN